MSGRGGKREGAGRKARIAPDSPRVHVNVTLSKDVHERLIAHAEGLGPERYSEAVEHFLRRGLELPAAQAALIGKEIAHRDGNAHNYDMSNLEVRDIAPEGEE